MSYAVGEARRSEYVTVGGRHVWHEVHGSAGTVVVLLHGGFAGAPSWDAQVPALVEAGFHVYVPERRGHGHTPDVAGPITYAAMAHETIEYLEEIVRTPAHLIGWSDGAVVAMIVAMRRPELVERMVVIGQFYNRDGRLPDSALDRMLHSPESTAYLRAAYDPVSPDGPEHFPVVYEKMLAMIDSEPEIALPELRRVTAPTLVLQGDRDEVTLEHGAAVAAALSGGRLAVLPGSHALPIELPDVVNPLLVTFLHRGAPGPLLNSQ
ncbi:MAG TPA: alpha/beta hydrolase [Aeromicrobium sp.]|nr:alpha/beta hydrolase [Aeromicrobium sp.]